VGHQDPHRLSDTSINTIRLDPTTATRPPNIDHLDVGVDGTISAPDITCC
jgi:hypothetical protein